MGIKPPLILFPLKTSPYLSENNPYNAKSSAYDGAFGKNSGGSGEIRTLSTQKVHRISSAKKIAFYCHIAT